MLKLSNKLTGLLFTLLAILIVFSCNEWQEKDSDPSLLENPSGRFAAMSRMFATDSLLYMSWVEEIDSLAVLKYATYNGASWSDPEVIAEGTDWFVNWADFPQIAVNQGNIFAHYLQKSAPDTYAYDIKYRIFNPEKNQWTSPRKLHTDSTQSEHGFVSVIPYQKGFMASWLDGRTTVNRPDSLKQMTLRAATINADGTLGKSWELDPRVCDCCATSITDSQDGPIVVYRDRSEDEIRDIYTTQFNGENWSKPQAVHNDNWRINGCPVNGPAIASSSSTSSILWFTAADQKPMVNLIISRNEKTEFTDPTRLDLRPAIGRVAVEVDDKGNTYALFMSEAEPDAVLSLAVFNAKGEQLKFLDLFAMDDQRSSGFPQMQLFKEQLYVSYNDTGVDPGVKTYALALSDLLNL